MPERRRGRVQCETPERLLMASDGVAALPASVFCLPALIQLTVEHRAAAVN